MEFTDPPRPSLVKISHVLVRNLVSIPTKDSLVPTSSPSGSDNSLSSQVMGSMVLSFLPSCSAFRLVFSLLCLPGKSAGCFGEGSV